MAAKCALTMRPLPCYLGHGEKNGQLSGSGNMLFWGLHFRHVAGVTGG
jgi:hypothetical protein